MKKEEVKIEIPEEVVDRMIAGAWAKEQSKRMLKETKWEERIKKVQEEIDEEKSQMSRDMLIQAKAEAWAWEKSKRMRKEMEEDQGNKEKPLKK